MSLLCRTSPAKHRALGAALNCESHGRCVDRVATAAQDLPADVVGAGRDEVEVMDTPTRLGASIELLRCLAG